MRQELLWVWGVWFFSAGQLFAQSLPATATGASGAHPTTLPFVYPEDDGRGISASGGALPTADPPTADGAGTGQGGKAKGPAGTGLGGMAEGSAFTGLGGMGEGSAGAGQSVVAGGSAVENVPPCRGWVRLEYLLWWAKNTPVPVPIVTTGNALVGFDPNAVNTVNTAGAVGQPGTQVLLGGKNINSEPYSGMRLTVGCWIDAADRFGVEVSGFVLERLTNINQLTSDASGNPPLYFPIFSPVVGAERAVPIADPLRGFSGNVSVNSALHLWGAECNGVFVPYCTPYLQLICLAGFRYANLREDLTIQNSTTDLIFNNVTNLIDSFRTNNQFFGGQIGGRLAVQFDRLFLDVTGKVALGSTYQVIDIQGAITQVGPNPLVPPGAGTFLGGLFTQPSNIGLRSANQFTVLPSLGLRLGFALSNRARVFAGYDILYWNRVVRPGNQIDRNVNLSQNAVLDPAGAGTLVGPAQPAPLFNRSDFWAQGISLGLEYCY